MSRKLGLWLMLFLLLLTEVAVQAQQATEGVHQPPKVLIIVRESMKPGKSGSPHQKTESAFVSAFTAAKWPTHYLAMDSQSGAPRSLFFIGYPTFEAWQEDNANTQKNASLAAALDKATIGDGEMLSGIETSAFVFREDQSHTAGVEIPHMRYMEISLFHVRPGHQADWNALVKMYQDGFKDMPDVHWAVYQSNYGQLGDGTFLVITPMKSASEIDKGFGDSKKSSESLGADGMKKLSELSAAAIESSQTNLFMFNPTLSYVGDDWKKADPFWQTKSAAPMKKAETKPKQ
jgi:hypothetical protein